MRKSTWLGAVVVAGLYFANRGARRQKKKASQDPASSHDGSGQEVKFGKLIRRCSQLYGLTLLVMGGPAPFVHPHYELDQFGAEYGTIADSLASGRGFANLISGGSGPTAWMPPLLPALYAGLFKLFGPRTVASQSAAYLLKISAESWCYSRLLHWSARRAGARGVGLAAALGIVTVWVDSYKFTRELDDVWVVHVAGCLVLDSLTEGDGQGPLATALTSLALPLTTPALCPPFCLLQAAQGLSRLRRWLQGQPGQSFPWRPLVRPTLCLLSVAAWTARNFVVFQRFYPVKSNFWFDFVEANRWIEDGITTRSSSLEVAPYCDNPMRQRYLEMGETAFLDWARGEAGAITLSDWLTRCWNRLRNACYRLEPEYDFARAFELEPGDLEILREAGLVRTFGTESWWQYCRVGPDKAAIQRIEALPLEFPAQALRSRRQAILYVERRESFPKHRLRRYWMTLVPAVASLVVAAARLAKGGAEPPPADLALAVYWSYLLPYIGIQHYGRYQQSTVYLQSYLEVCAISAALGWPKPGRRT